MFLIFSFHVCEDHIENFHVGVELINITRFETLELTNDHLEIEILKRNFDLGTTI
jgi:hypothetical protein